MGRPRAPRWTSAEITALREVYPEHGMKAALAMLPGRSSHSIYVQASKLNIRTGHRPTRPGIYRDIAAKALEIYQRLGSYSAAAIELGVCEGTATNAVHHARNLQSGQAPLERDHNGRITAAAIDRLRRLFRKGLTHRDIQKLTGVSAATLTRERRRYEAYLKERGLAPIPPRNHGAAYSGNRVPASKKKEVEREFLDGFGTRKVSEATGVSKTVCTRIRNHLVARLRRKGECLPGCDFDGTRRTMRDHARHVPQESVERLKELILDRVPVRRAAKICGIGGCTAYRIRDAMKAELGDAMPTPRLPGRVRPLQRELMNAQAIPPEKLQRFRGLVYQQGDTEARRLLRAEISAERANMTFEERVAAIRDPSQIIASFKPTKASDLGGSLVGSSAAQAVDAA
jgi:hypothetical protein